ncbi:hypothetical protein OOZ51_13260 [Arthrobacter sp. MI7-26]|nr:hypothetical protein [Arthrobacter sp. MI7-26]MCX2748773.1 hypothetical protein [Arthrobacter sp. MI7-26]
MGLHDDAGLGRVIGNGSARLDAIAQTRRKATLAGWAEHRASLPALVQL